MRFAGAEGRVEAQTALKVAEDFSKKWKLEIVLLNADLVFGKEHLLSAYEHAKRAFASGTNKSKSMGKELILYAAGERQISKAIDKMGIRDGLRNVAIVLIGKSTNAQMSKLLSSLNMKRNDDVILPKEKNLQAFGISKEEMGTVPKEKRSKLVLEKVALVDLLK